MLFAGVYACTFQPGNFTRRGSEGVQFASGRQSLFQNLYIKRTCIYVDCYNNVSYG